jgi:hypothetical protein
VRNSSRAATLFRLRVATFAVAGILVYASGSAGVADASEVGQGAADGRAWEMVSPLEKNSGDIRGIDKDSGGGVIQASADGNRATYVSQASFGEPQGASVGSQYVSDRDASQGWLTQNISLAMNAQTYALAGVGTPYDAFSTDLTVGLVFGGARGYRGGSEHLYPVENPPLAGSPAGYEDYYLREIPFVAEPGPAHLEALLTHTPSQPPESFGLEFVSATPDLNHVVVASRAALAPGAVEVADDENLYEWERATGQFQPLNILPNGAPDPEHKLNLGGEGETEHAISEDGSSVVWTATSSRAMYVREHIGTPQAKTVQVDAAVGGSGNYSTASSDGSKIFFIKGGLYEYEVSTGQTTDIAPGGVVGMVGVSKDGSYVYYVDAAYNLKLWHEGATTLIATLSQNDSSQTVFNHLGVAFDWRPEVGLQTARVTSDGTRLVFMSERSLTGYDNTVSSGGSCGEDSSSNPLPAPCEEVFLYDAGANHLSCVSCNPAGSRPTGPSSIVGGTEFANHKATYRPRALSADGSRVFFNSGDALVPQDTNGKEDVYEYENGHVYLLSGGNGAAGATFVDASASGDDVFFITRAPLVDRDTDQLVDLYDARAPHVPGEAVGSPAPVTVTPCEGEGCRQTTPAAPTFVSPSSAAFTGVGNVAPGSEAVSKKKGKSKKAKSRRRTKKKKRVRSSIATGAAR